MYCRGVPSRWCLLFGWLPLSILSCLDSSTESWSMGGGTLGGRGLVLWMFGSGRHSRWDECPAFTFQLRFPNGCSVGESSAENRAGPCRVQTELEPPLKIATVARAGGGLDRKDALSCRRDLGCSPSPAFQRNPSDQHNLFPCLHFPCDIFPPTPLSTTSTTPPCPPPQLSTTSTTTGLCGLHFLYPAGRSLMPPGTARPACFTPPLVGT